MPDVDEWGGTLIDQDEFGGVALDEPKRPEPFVAETSRGGKPMVNFAPGQTFEPSPIAAPGSPGDVAQSSLFNLDVPLISPEFATSVSHVSSEALNRLPLPESLREAKYGAEESAGQMVAGMTSPKSLAMLPLFGIPYVGPLLAGAYGAEAAGTGAGRTVAAIEQGNPREIGAGLTETAGGLSMMIPGAAHSQSSLRTLMDPTSAALRAEIARGSDLTPAERAEAGRRATNLAAPGTMRPQELEAVGPPGQNAPPMFELGDMPFEAAPRFGTTKLAEPQVLPQRGFLPEPEIIDETRSKQELETRGKVSFGAEAPTLLREAIQTAEDVGLKKSAAAAAQGAVEKKGEPNASPVTETTAIHGDVQPREASASQLPAQESGGGIQPQAGGGIPGAEGQKAPAEVSLIVSRIEALPTEEAVKLNQKAEMFQGLNLKPEDAPTLAKASAAAFDRFSALVEAGKEAEAQAEFGRGIFYNGAIEWALKKGPNYDASMSLRGTETAGGQVPEVPRTENAGIPENAPPLAGAAGKNERAILRESVPEARETEAGAVQGLRPEGGKAPSGLQQTAGGGVVVPEAPSSPARGTKAAGGGTLAVAPEPGIPVEGAGAAPAAKPPVLAEASMGAATPGAFPVSSPVQNAFNAAVKPLQKARAAIGQLWQSRDVREAMAATRDAGDNQALNFGHEMANEIRNAVKRAFPDKTERAMDALTAFVEAGSDEARLLQNRDTIETSTAGSDKWRNRALAAHDFALYNQDALRPIAERYREITRAQVGDEHTAGIDTLVRDDYVMHAQDIDSPLSMLSGGGTDATSFRKVRTHPTYADSIAAGVDPHTLNAADLLELRLQSGQRMINRRAWLDGLRGMSDPASGQPVAAQPTVVTRADGTTYPQAPPGYSLERLGNQSVAVHNGYEGIFSALTDPSAFTQNAAGRSFLAANALGKSVNLMLDTFHLGRLALWESLIKGLGVTTFKAPFPSYRKGLTLLDHSIPELQRMAANGEIPQEWLQDLTANKGKLDALVKNGYNLGRVSDALYQNLIHEIPGIGHFNKWLFGQFQRGAMSEIGLLEYDRLQRARPNMTPDEIARAVAKDLNTRFGNLGRQGIFKSRTAQDLARTIFLAPQWNEGLIRSELGSIKQLGEFVKDTAQGKKLYAGVLLRSVGGMALMQFAANQLINLYTRGHPTWENKEEGDGAKLSAWIPDKVGNGPGFFLHPLGLAAETTHLLLQKYEKTEDFARTLKDYVRSRSSAAMRPLLTFITREDELGRKIRPDKVWGKIVQSALPVPIGVPAGVGGAKQLVTGQPAESFPGQFQKQLMATVGIKTDQTPSGQQRMSAMAKDFNRAKGIEPQAEFYEGDYVPLLRALGIGNESEAQAALEELLKKKTRAQLQKYFAQLPARPFTGNRRREGEFKQTLSEEQRAAYDAALEERRRVRQAFYDLLRKQ